MSFWDYAAIHPAMAVFFAVLAFISVVILAESIGRLK